MKIEGPGAPAAAAAPSRASGAAATGFSPSVSGPRETAAAGPMAVAAPVHSLDALLALQSAPGPMERRRRAVKRGGRLLDILDEVKLSLLAGEGAAASLDALRGAVQEARLGVDDPRLEGVLDEIDTRAAVELAKQETAAISAVGGGASG